LYLFSLVFSASIFLFFFLPSLCLNY
jgi:hypothetical protein